MKDDPGSAPPHPGRVLLAPLYAGGIYLESRLSGWLPSVQLRFPRDLAEVEAAPERLFALVGGALPAGASLVSVRRRGRMVNEPDKDRTTAAFDVTYRVADATSVLPVFVKFQSGRGMPLLLQAVRAAVEPGVAREVDFYRHLAGTVPLRSPRPYFADSITAVNRVCLVLEHVDGVNPADWRGASLPAVRAILGDVARMNAAFVGRTASDPRTAWIPARAGLDYASYVATLGGLATAAKKKLWRALERFFRERPVTLVHGDCRPGNMLFRGADPTREGGAEHDAAPWPDAATPAPDVVFADWEAVNVAPLLWDFTYCTTIGLRVADRRAHLPRLRDEFLATLRAHGVPAESCDAERCAVEVELLTLVLCFIASLIVTKGYWDNQGNTFDDYRAWSTRIVAAVRAVDARRAAAALGVPRELVERFQREAAFAAREPAATKHGARVPAADPAAVGALLDAQGDAGWLAVTQRFGRVFRLHGGVVTCEPEDFQKLLNTRAHAARRSAPHRFADRFVPGAAGILFKDGEPWKRRLGPLMTGFTHAAVAAGEGRVRALVEDAVAAWPETHAGPDLFAEVTRIGLRVALVEGYNLDPDDPAVAALGETLVAYKVSTMHPDARRRLDQFGISWRKAADLPRVAMAFRDFRRLVEQLDALVAEIVWREPWADPARKGWVQVLTEAGLGGRELTSELNHLYGAFTAADYTATAAIAELAHAPEWVARLRSDDDGRARTVDAILHETSRRYPVAMVIYRELGEPMVIGGETFPAGTTVMALPYALHHDAAWWDRPEAFDPGRWLGELPARARAAYEPFLRGPRRCIGQDFARTQLRVLLEAIFRRHELLVSRRPRVNSFVIPRFAEPIPFTFTPISHAGAP